MKRAAFVALAAIALGACAAPSSFDGLTGGIVVDESIGAPRSMSPISVSMVATSRPKLKWLLSGSLTGAIVEMSKTRDFSPSTTKTFVGSGSELVVPEDLEPGIWFWRLSGSTPAARGIAKSPIWEILVRGPARFGSSDAPSGALVDTNADGIPDLLTTGDVTDPEYGDMSTIPIELRGNEKGELLAPTDRAVSMILAWGPPNKAPTPVTIGGGTDFDGDGYSDFAYATYQDWGDEYGAVPIIESMPGSEKGIDQSRPNHVVVGFDPGFLEPTIASAGDVDGDGFGDMIIGAGQVSFVARGGGKTLTSTIPVFPIVDYPSDIHAGAVLGAFDADGDGISDLAVAQPRINLQAWNEATEKRPGAIEQRATFGTSEVTEADEAAGYPLPDFRRAVALSSGIAKSLASTRFLSVSRAPVEGATAKSMASGDFNGDGLADVASVLVDATGTRVCVSFGSRDRFLVDGGCIEGIETDARGIAGVAAGDLEGDGQDELLVASGGKVRAVHFDQQGGRTTEVIAEVPRVASIATVWPGRPNQARWVVSDGNTIIMFEGTREKQRIEMPLDVVRGWGRVMR